jgi:hypothetical protein
MMYAIQFLGLAGIIIEGQSERVRSELPGQYLLAYDPDAHEGQGFFDATRDIKEAMHFDSIAKAWECWAQVSTVKPKRADGQPNRPLTAMSITVVQVPD